MTLLQFLSRPVKWKQGTFSLTDTLGKAEFAVGRTLIDLLTDIPMWKEKLRGYFGIRYDLKLRLILNANKHQQGLYKLSAIPVGDAVSGTESSYWLDNHISTRLQRSMLHGVEIDLSRDTEVVLSVPYVSKRLFSMLAPNASFQQYIRIFPVIPMSSGTGANNCSWTLFASLENVSLFGQVVPQSAIDREQMKGKIGPIGLTLRKIAKSANIVSQVPLLTAFATPVSWAADLASQVAYVFGWSRPTDLSTYSNHVLGVLPGFSNYDVADRSRQLAPMARNQLQMTPEAFGTLEDELDFTHFLSRYALLTSFTWSLTDTVDTEKYSLPQSPNVMSRIVTGGFLPIYHHTPVSLLGEMFEMWRGSFSYRLKFVKTQFHSGRLEIVFSPIFFSGVSMPQDSPWLQKTIIDIRDRTEYEFEVPWICPHSYLTMTDAFGYLQINIVEELSCPDTVSSTIDVVVEMCCCEDFEFAKPKAPAFNAPYFNVTPQSGLGDSKVVYTRAPMVRAIGESVRSWRQLLKIPSFFDYTGDKSTFQSQAFIPFGTTYPVRNVASNLTANSVDTYGVLSSIFLFSSGSVRIKGFTPFVQDFKVQAMCTNVLTDISYFSSFGNPTISQYPYTNDAWRLNTPSAILGEQESVEVQIPQYGFNVVRNSIDCFMTPSTSPTPATYKFEDVSPALVVAQAPAGKSLATFKFYRSGGDDCNFGHFVSIPPMTQSKCWT